MTRNNQGSHTMTILLWCCIEQVLPQYTVSILGRDEGYTVKYAPLPEGVPEDKALGNS